MFDDNYSSAEDQWFDSLSARIACDLVLGKYSSKDVNYTDNFNKVKRPLTRHEVLAIYDLFEKVLETYYEYKFLWQTDVFKHQDFLFPEYNVTGMQHIFPMTNPTFGDEGRYHNVVFLKLNEYQNITSIREIVDSTVRFAQLLKMQLHSR
jgi:hypothetical protein